MKAALSVLVVVLALLALTTDATDTLRRTRTGRSLAALRRLGNDLKDVDNEFKDIEKTLAKELSAVANDAKAERAFYNKMTKQITKLVGEALKIGETALVGDAIKKLDEAVLEKAAKLSYKIRHWLRVNVREHQSKRVCAWILAWVVRVRDLLVYGSTDGPDWAFVVTKAGGDPKAAKVLPSGVSIGIIQGAQSTNKQVNKLMNVQDDTKPTDAPVTEKVPKEIKLPVNEDTKKMLTALPPPKPVDIPKDETCAVSDHKMAEYYMGQLESAKLDGIGAWDSQQTDNIDDAKLRKQF